MLTILVADDDPDHLEVLAMVLGFDGHEVTTAGDGGAVLELLRAGTSYDVVVVDLNMPVAGGLEVVDHLRREGKLGTTTVIAMSADPEEKQASLVAGASEFLTKPFGLRTLRALVLASVRAEGQGS